MSSFTVLVYMSSSVHYQARTQKFIAELQDTGFDFLIHTIGERGVAVSNLIKEKRNEDREFSKVVLFFLCIYPSLPMTSRNKITPYVWLRLTDSHPAVLRDIDQAAFWYADDRFSLCLQRTALNINGKMTRRLLNHLSHSKYLSLI